MQAGSAIFNRSEYLIEMENIAILDNEEEWFEQGVWELSGEEHDFNPSIEWWL